MNTERKGFKVLTLDNIILFIILSFIFLGSLNLINRYYYCIYIAALLFLVSPRRKICFNFTFVTLICLSLSILIFDPSSQTMITSMIKPFTYPLCYLMGLCMFTYGNQQSNDLLKEEKRTSAIVLVIAAGVMLHFILNMFTNWGITTRHVIDFWTKNEMSATGQATLACIMIAVAAAFIFSKVGKAKKIIAIVSLLTILSYNLILAGRTIFVLMLIVLGFAFLYNLYENKISWESVSLIIVVVVVVILLLTLYNNNVFGVKDTFEASNFYDRFLGGDNTQDLDDDSRFHNKLYYVEHFFDSMLGGGHIRAEFGHSAHDLYLDTYDESGIFALLSVVIYIFASIGRAAQCALNKNISFKTRLLILCVYLVVNIQFWLEPIMRGVPWLFAAYCLIDGAVTRLLIEDKKYSENKIVS